MNYMYNTKKILKPKYWLPSKKSTYGLYVQYLKNILQPKYLDNQWKKVHNSTHGDN